MYDSAPKEREGERIEEVLPAAIYTTSSSGRGPVPLRSLTGVAAGGQGRIIVTLSVLCAMLFVAFVIALLL